MRRRLPPLEQIEAFIQAAEAPTFRVAAERCALSPAAFSRRIQAFSAFAGEPLFERTGAGARLTQAGRDRLDALKPAYLELRRAAAGLERREGPQVVSLSLSHSLAVGWLIPRLDRFRAAHPEIELRLRSERGSADMRRGEADLGICYSDIDLTGLLQTSLLEVSVAPVAAPAVAAAFAEHGNLREHRLLAGARPIDLWPWWAREAGMDPTLPKAETYDLLHAMYEMAAGGFGVALGATPTVWPHIESGRLVRLPLPQVAAPGGYRLAAPADRRRRAPVAAVWRWLEGEAARTEGLAAAA